MKFSINREQLLKPLQQVASVVERRQTLPVLSNVLLEVSGGRLSLTGTDLELELVARLDLGADAQDGETTVPARKLVDICKSLPAEADIKVESDGERLLIKSGRSRFTLSTLPANEFPNLEEESEGTGFSIPPATLRQLIDRTAFSMAQQDVRYYLNGMLFELGANKLRTVATDGHRLAMCDAEVEGLKDKAQVILPRKGVMSFLACSVMPPGTSRSPSARTMFAFLLARLLSRPSWWTASFPSTTALFLRTANG